MKKLCQTAGLLAYLAPIIMFGLILLVGACHGQQVNSTAASLDIYDNNPLVGIVYPTWAPPFALQLLSTGGNLSFTISGYHGNHYWLCGVHEAAIIGFLQTNFGSVDIPKYDFGNTAIGDNGILIEGNLPTGPGLTITSPSQNQYIIPYTYIPAPFYLSLQAVVADPTHPYGARLTAATQLWR